MHGVCLKSYAMQIARNDAQINWAPGATGTLTQFMTMNANPGFTGIVQNGQNN